MEHRSLRSHLLPQRTCGSQSKSPNSQVRFPCTCRSRGFGHVLSHQQARPCRKVHLPPGLKQATTSAVLASLLGRTPPRTPQKTSCPITTIGGALMRTSAMAAKPRTACTISGYLERSTPSARDCKVHHRIWLWSQNGRR